MLLGFCVAISKCSSRKCIVCVCVKFECAEICIAISISYMFKYVSFSDKQEQNLPY